MTTENGVFTPRNGTIAGGTSPAEGNKATRANCLLRTMTLDCLRMVTKQSMVMRTNTDQASVRTPQDDPLQGNGFQGSQKSDQRIFHFHFDSDSFPGLVFQAGMTDKAVSKDSALDMSCSGLKDRAALWCVISYLCYFLPRPS